MTLKEIGKNVEKIRKAKGWTLNYAAKKASMGWGHLRNIEAGECNTTLRIIYRISQKWEVPIIDFFKAPRKMK